MAQASYPHYPVSPRIHLLGLDFVFNTYSTGSSYRLSREHKPSDLTPAPHDTTHLQRSKPFIPSFTSIFLNPTSLTKSLIANSHHLHLWRLNLTSNTKFPPSWTVGNSGISSNT